VDWGGYDRCWVFRILLGIGIGDGETGHTKITRGVWIMDKLLVWRWDGQGEHRHEDTRARMFFFFVTYYTVASFLLPLFFFSLFIPTPTSCNTLYKMVPAP